MKEKYELWMDPLFPNQVDDLIENTSKVAETRNALQTHKKSGWKASFIKYKRKAEQEKEEAARIFREQLQQEIAEKK